jgi:phenylalanyl-tRNA synthetase beta chain
MKIALSWLRQWVDTKATPEEIAHTLTMGGLEVEDLHTAPAFTAVVLAQVLQVERHPNADRLNVCQVNTGDAAPRTVVCGAPNVAPGLWVPCALPGAVLPGDFQIKVSKVRGIQSEGMLCSAKELGLAEDASGLMILEAGVAGADLRQVLDLDEPVIEIKTTPNRGDCLSVQGVARELAALSGLPLNRPVTQVVAVNHPETAAVTIADPRLCGRFSGRVLRGLDARAATPGWMKRRLEQSGQRGISALVDISNYVMLELGQPSHVFDLDKVVQPITARWAQAGERVTLLNEQTVELTPDMGVVADASGPEAIAGIMGGLPTSVTLDTQNVFVEAAFWWPDAIQGRPRRLNFSSEAAHRFERGTDCSGTVDALERITQLIIEICGTAHTQVGPVTDVDGQRPQRVPVEMRFARLQKVLGIPVTPDQAVGVFQRLGMPCERLGEQSARVTPPGYRFDIEREEDLIEEVARVIGYESIPDRPPVAPAYMRAQPEGQRRAHDLRVAMAQAGYQELVNFSFVPDDWEAEFADNPAAAIRVLNPIASQYSLMRSRLAPGLIGNLRYNLNRQATRVRSFELARVFTRQSSQQDAAFAVAGIHQPTHLAALAYGPRASEQWGEKTRAVDFFDLKGDLEALVAPLGPLSVAAPSPDSSLTRFLHPGRSATVALNGVVIGWIGELHPRLLKLFDLPAAPVMFEVAVDPLLVIGLPQLHDVPRFPALVRDIALWVDEAVPAGEVLADLLEQSRRDPELAIIREVNLFDVFRPATQQTASGDASNGLLTKEKSLAFRVQLQDTQRSLTETDADAARAAVVRHLTQRWGARERQ